MIYHAFQNKMKKWMFRFHGIATKYLANYMYWFKWLQFFNIEKGKQLSVQLNTAQSDTKLKDFKTRKAIYV